MKANPIILKIRVPDANENAIQPKTELSIRMLVVHIMKDTMFITAVSSRLRTLNILVKAIIEIIDH